MAMLGMFIEYDCYDIVKEMKRQGQDSGTVIGRINKYHYHKEKGTLPPKHVRTRSISSSAPALLLPSFLPTYLPSNPIYK